MGNGPNVYLLGSRLGVGQLILDQYAGVRILPPQPFFLGGIV